MWADEFGMTIADSSAGRVPDLRIGTHLADDIMEVIGRSLGIGTALIGGLLSE